MQWTTRNAAIASIFIGLLSGAGCGNSPQNIPGLEQPPGPQDSDPLPPDPDHTADTACYPGREKVSGSCVEVVTTAEAQLGTDDYEYLEPLPENNFPKFLPAGQYPVPKHLVDLESTEPNKYLSPNFILDELMSLRKGPFAIFLPSTLITLQSMRLTLGAPLFITSAYRSPAYNAGVGGAKWSRHMYGDAVDFFSSGANLEELAEVCTEHGASFYQIYSQHIHCDWRNHPMDPPFYPPSMAPSEKHIIAKNLSQQTFIQHSKLRGEQTLSVSHPSPEDGEPLRYRWRVFKGDSLVYEFDGQDLVLPNRFSKATLVEVTVGGSIKTSLKLR